MKQAKNTLYSKVYSKLIADHGSLVYRCTILERDEIAGSRCIMGNALWYKPIFMASFLTVCCNNLGQFLQNIISLKLLVLD